MKFSQIRKELFKFKTGISQLANTAEWHGAWPAAFSPGARETSIFLVNSEILHWIFSCVRQLIFSFYLNMVFAKTFLPVLLPVCIQFMYSILWARKLQQNHLLVLWTQIYNALTVHNIYKDIVDLKFLYCKKRFINSLNFCTVKNGS